MKSFFLLFICILSGITATESSISCMKCVGENAHTCKGAVDKCSSTTDDCISLLEVAKIGIRETSVFMRLCGNCSQHQTGNVRFDKGILKINVSCCSHDNCTPTEPTFASDKPSSKYEKFKSNGIRCKSCFASNAKGCDCNVFLNCTGGETKCISRSISTSGGHLYSVAIRGCTTTEMCEVAGKDEKLNTTQVRSSYTCTGESDSIHNALGLLVLTATLFSKFTTTT
ncbi:uncharacterized protein RB166_011409 [Leptodactylus fuscus]